MNDVSEASCIRLLLQLERGKQTYSLLSTGIPSYKDDQRVGILSLYLKKQLPSETSVYSYAYGKTTKLSLCLIN
jgi:hypothetical protein